MRVGSGFKVTVLACTPALRVLVCANYATLLVRVKYLDLAAI